jgi:hypothetical protein
MTLRFWRRVRVIPGLRINLSKSGASFSVGRKGMWFTAGPRGRRATVGMPGTGLFWTEKIPPARTQKEPSTVLVERWRWPILIAGVVVATCLLAWLTR